MGKEINNNGYDYVDLGLPSETLWAVMNVGASKPSDYGLFFQWGDTIGYTKDQVGRKKQFNWTDYRWNPAHDGKTFTKYNTDGAALELEDDAAHVNMGGSWHMPSPKQIRELLDNTITVWTTLDGIIGITFTSINDTSKSMFIPAPGFAWDGLAYNSGCDGNVWTSMLSAYSANYGQSLYFNSDGSSICNFNRYDGQSVRGVIG